jgi:hypothetical protein
VLGWSVTDGNGSRTMPLSEAARRYGLNQRTLQYAARRGTLDATLLHGRWWVTTSDAVEAWIKDAPHRPGRAPRQTGRQ